MRLLSQRIIRAMQLDRQLYEEVERDPRALAQAAIVVGLSSVATIAGLTGRISSYDVPAALALGIVAWAGWAAIAFLVGTQVCPESETRSDWGELLRTTGFAAAPGLLSVFGLLPALQGLITFIASIWMLLAFSVAVRQALDYRSTVRAVAVCSVGWALYAGMLFVFMPRV
jgi:hypothetical protein